MRIRTALSTLALAAASLAVGAGGAIADDAPDVTVNNSSSTAFPGVCASNQFSFVTVPVNLAGGSDSGAC
ncbi:hypothetical protein [Streptomyces violaceusniger]|uniref:hypothetical protein n=1 Tax=Streptomyces violaceusniger TaxID=68280 RepID=UPI000996BFE2|nr:hypothetical protein [Streptomyces hygroscopicus]AQW54823.1 hypothetical protein SHXM_08286 [Streptomyces hygroscopicus]